MKKFYYLLLLTALMINGGGNAFAQVIKYSDSGYKCWIDNKQTPTVWSSAGWDGVITMYLGGWKYQSGSELASVYGEKLSDGYTNNGEIGNKIKDYWEESAQDGDYYNKNDDHSKNYYQCFFSDFKYRSWGGGDNARSEFVEPKKDSNGNNGVAGKYGLNFNGFGNGNPFTVPCFGTFLKFEPEKNGTVDLYIIQNGIIDLSSSSGGSDKLDDKAKWRPLYIVDELGKMLSDEGTDAVTVGMPDKNYHNDENNYQKIYIGWDGSSEWSGTKVTPNEKGTADGYILPNMNDVGDKVTKFLAKVQGSDLKGKLSKEQWAWLTGDTKEDATDTRTATDIIGNETPYWTAGGTKMRMMPPKHSKDGWIAINKTYVKYTFKVKTGKSYYVFMNDSQIGFCGYEFKPDGTATTSELTLNEDGTFQKGNDKGRIGNTLNGFYDNVILNRTFHKGWNAICLPFSVTESKMREWFGSEGKTEDYELVTYNGVGIHNGRVKAFFFHHVYQDILAGYPYMLWIPEKAPVLTKGENPYFKNITIENEGFDMKKFTVSTDYTTNASADLMNVATKNYYSFQGFYEPEELKKDSYVVTANGLQFYGDETYDRPESLKLDGFRAYLQGNVTSEAKEMVRISGTNFTNILERMDDWNATVIDDIAEEMGFFSRPSNVYSISGQIVRQNSTSLVGLPKGIYIVNGKKYIVNK